MVKSNVGPANEAIDGILELSAHAHVRRREVAKDSPEFHALKGAIAAYGNVLALLTSFPQREEFDPIVGQNKFCEYVAVI